MTVVEVHLHGGAGAPIHAGTADIATRRGATASRFAYQRAYQAGPGWALSPDLPVDGGETVVDGLPGALADSAPDAWGRNLIVRRLARQWAGHASPTPTEADFLLGVSDVTRQGALRFATGGGFLAEGAEVPPTIELERLLAAATAVAGDGLGADDQVAELLDAGSGSLGGARPKASVIDGDTLSIAKFPHPDDRWDVMRWEAVALDLAETCGLTVPDRRLEVLGHQAVLVVARFDRRGVERVPYLSARSLTGSGLRPGDYLEIADGISDHGSDVERDLRSLWGRLAFSVAINNTDDHLRNHGFLRAGPGWTLAPVFDVNPDPNPAGRRATSVGGRTEAEACRRALIDLAPRFGLEPADAEHRWHSMVAGVSSWRDVARERGITDQELDRFAPVLDRFSVERG